MALCGSCFQVFMQGIRNALKKKSTNWKKMQKVA